MKIKKIVTFLFILMLAIMNVGCAVKEEDVKLSNKMEILIYANMLYGKAEYISAKEYEEGIYINDEFERYRPRAIEYKLKDDKYGFEYTVTSMVSSIGIDGTIFSYNETKVSNFDDAYAKYIMSELENWIKQEESNLDIVVIPGRYPESIFANVMVNENTNIDKAIEFTIDFGEKFMQIDDRKWFRESPIYLIDTYNERIGLFETKEGCYKSNEESIIDFYIGRASVLLNARKKDLIYTYNKKLPLNEIKGLDEFTIEKYIGVGLEKAICYYFEYNKQEYFVVGLEYPGWYYQHVYNVTDDVLVNVYKP